MHLLTYTYTERICFLSRVCHLHFKLILCTLSYVTKEPIPDCRGKSVYTIVVNKAIYGSYTFIHKA